MRNIIVLLFLIVVFSCKKKKDIHFYYPNKAKFLKLSTELPVLEFKSFKNFDQLVETLERLPNKKGKAIFKLNKNEVTYSFIVSTFFQRNSNGLASIAPRIKRWNILSVSKDSILKNNNFYAVDSLSSYLKKDLLHKERDMIFADSPEKFSISITEKKVNLERLLIRLFKAYNAIKKESKDSLEFNIQFNKIMQIYPSAPICI